MGAASGLDADSLLAAAAAEAGLSDYGDRAFIEPLQRWCEALASEVELSAMGAEIIRANTTRLLVNRLRFEDDLKRHPEILDEDVSDPIVIVGLPRTGTTKLQRLVASLARMRGIPFWQLLNPAPFPAATAGEPDPRIAFGEQSLAMSSQIFPEFQAGHPSRLHDVDEEMFMMEMCFETMTYWRADLPKFQQWWRERPRQTPYAYLRKLLQYVQWQSGKQGRSLVLKSPLHLGFVDMIHEHFPKATLVQCHRDPRVSVASNARLHELIWKMSMTDVDPIRVGDEVIDFWSRALADNLAQREALGEQLQILDVRYEQIVHQSEQVVRNILKLHGLPFEIADAKAIRDWETFDAQQQQAAGSAPKHEYSQDRYGLSDERIEQAFSGYFQKFFAEELVL